MPEARETANPPTDGAGSDGMACAPCVAPGCSSAAPTAALVLASCLLLPAPSVVSGRAPPSTAPAACWRAEKPPEACAAWLEPTLGLPVLAEAATGALAPRVAALSDELSENDNAATPAAAALAPAASTVCADSAGPSGATRAAAAVLGEVAAPSPESTLAPSTPAAAVLCAASAGLSA